MDGPVAGMLHARTNGSHRCNPGLIHRVCSALVFMKVTLNVCLAVLLYLPSVLIAAEPPPKGEPTNAVEAAAQKARHEAALDKKYNAWVATLSPEAQAWETVLQQNLGGFYLSGHKQDKIAGKSDAWDFVTDHPGLPRVLLIGDSVSRGYTLPVRKVLQSKVNVHRAPENCGPTANGLKKIEIWLGKDRWDVIHFNFGIHDRNTPLADYKQRLEQLLERLSKTGAKLVWASTTPIPDDPSKNQSAASIVEKNAAAAELMSKYGVVTDDLFTAVSPLLGTLQRANDVHFTDEGYEFLGGQVAASIESVLKR